MRDSETFLLGVLSSGSLGKKSVEKVMCMLYGYLELRNRRDRATPKEVGI